MTFSIIAILTASLLGSLHCVGMCGGFVIYNSANSKSKIISNLLYNLGRLCTYIFLGFLAGLLGYALNKSSVFIGISHVSAVLVGILLITWGLKSFLGNSFPTKIQSSNRILNKISSFYSSILKNKYNISEYNRSLLLGLLSTLLPCGWLYSYVAIAAGSGSPLSGTLIMFVFWLGTIPALALTAFAAKISLGPAQKYLPRLTSIIIILAGIFSITMHFGLFMSGHHGQHHQHNHHQHQSH